ncbi:MAG: hypothetical protein IPG96_06365 [Proteobacteria bacterium]|nr:hypothetical protein [Pseudomonadota bacterium]
MPSLSQLMPKEVLVSPVAGVIDALQVGGGTTCVTVTEVESHCVEPPGPVACKVTVWLPAPKRLLGAEPEQGTGP